MSEKQTNPEDWENNMDRFFKEIFDKQAAEDNRIVGISNELSAIQYKKKGISMLKRVKGRWRLFWRLCPECNSDAPKMYDCHVCFYNREANGNWNERIKALWWYRFIKINS